MHFTTVTHALLRFPRTICSQSDLILASLHGCLGEPPEHTPSLPTVVLHKLKCLWGGVGEGTGNGLPWVPLVTSGAAGGSRGDVGKEGASSTKPAKLCAVSASRASPSCRGWS